MARATTTCDIFNALAESKRRAVIELLLDKELSVSELVLETGWNQPMVSKHLGVLREVNLVHEQRVGRKRIYSLNLQALRPMHDWLEQFSDYWNKNLDQLGEYLTLLQDKNKTGVKDD
jgi:DNA-binding transcriptional ArsR family regulator